MAGVKKLIKKKWFEIVAPAEFQKVVLGETLAGEARETVGRTIIRTLGSITGDIKKQGVNVTFKIVEAKEKSAFTELVKYELTSPQVKRLTKKAKDKAEDSFVCVTKDNIPVRIKLLILTRNTVQKRVLTGLRKAGRKYFADTLKEMAYSQVISTLLQDKFHRGLKEAAQKVYPPIFAEIRVVERAKGL